MFGLNLIKYIASYTRSEQLYILGGLTYVCYSTYNDATDILRRYNRSNGHMPYVPSVWWQFFGYEIIETPYDAVKAGAQYRFIKHVITANIWPLAVAHELLSATVLTLSNTTDTNGQEKND